MKVSAAELAREVEHAAGGQHVGALGVHVAGGHVLHDLRGAAALGVDHELGPGMLGAHGGDVGGADSGVHVALAVPDVHAPAGHALDVGAQPHVGAEQDLHVVAVLAADVLNHADRVRGRAAVVGLRLDLGRGVHVHHHDGARVLGLPGPQLIGRDRVGERAAGVEVGQQHGLVRAEDRGRLGHEVHAAERDHVGVRGRSLAREAERITHEVRHVLHLGHLVVVGEDHRVALLGEGAHLVLEAADLVRGERGLAGRREGGELDGLHFRAVFALESKT